jgi:multiple sugar transport system permease protein
MTGGTLLKRDSTFGFVLTLPALLVMAAVILYPLVYSFLLSFRRIDIIAGRQTWVGLTNYARLVLHDPVWWTSLLNTFVFVFAAVAGELVIGLLLALLLNGMPARGKMLLQTFFLVPMMIALVIAAMMWRWMLVDQYGIVNYVFTVLGFPAPQWFGKPVLAMLVLVFIDWWVATPFSMIVLFAGLQNVSPELIEAAKIDGASAWHRLFLVILPLLSPVMLFIILIRTMDAFRVFDIVYILTGGGPGTSTEVVTSYGYKLAFARLNFGETAALSVVTFVVIMIMSIFFLRVFDRDATSSVPARKRSQAIVVANGGV